VECDGTVGRSRCGGGRGAPSSSDISCVNRDGIIREIVNSFKEVKLKRFGGISWCDLKQFSKWW
jgi:hypothetical protein